MDPKHSRHASLIGTHILRTRRMRGISQRALAAKVGVSATAISKYERGLITPTSSVLGRLCTGLDVQLEALLRPEVVTGMDRVFYRLGDRIGSKEWARISAHTRDWLERYLITESILDVPDDPLAWADDRSEPVYCMAEVEDAALSLRRRWGLGEYPIANLTLVIEQHGVKIGTVSTDHPFEGCSFYAVTERDGSCPVIAIADPVSGDRQRFTLAHELAHLWLDIGEDLDVESAVNRFAAAFLVPEAAAIRELGAKRPHGIPIGELHTLKHTYGMSMQAWVRRARELTIVNERNYRDMLSLVTPDGPQGPEPGVPYATETPMRFERLVVRAYFDRVIGGGRASELLAVSRREFQEQYARHDRVTSN
jgi:Zn-dependent peptidase ImmA (M78 family)/transcriptional regulator with XRE-family HTH domain